MSERFDGFTPPQESKKAEPSIQTVQEFIAEHYPSQEEMEKIVEKELAELISAVDLILENRDKLNTSEVEYLEAIKKDPMNLELATSAINRDYARDIPDSETKLKEDAEAIRRKMKSHHELLFYIKKYNPWGKSK